MHRLFRVVSILMLALVCFHVFESDGPCDYEEYFSVLKKTISIEQSNYLPIHSDEHVHYHDMITPEHLGHASVVLLDDLKIISSPLSFMITFPEIPQGDIQHFVFEEYRPPRLS